MVHDELAKWEGGAWQVGVAEPELLGDMAGGRESHD